MGYGLALGRPLINSFMRKLILLYGGIFNLENGIGEYDETGEGQDIE